MTTNQLQGVNVDPHLTQYRAVLQFSPVPSWLSLPDVIVYANPACLQLLGARDETEIAGRAPCEFLSDSSYSTFAELPRAVACQAARDTRVRRVDGTWLDVEINGWPVPFGHESALQVSLTEISSRTPQRRELLILEQHLTQVLDSLFAFVGVMTPDGILIEANRAPLEAAEITKEQVLGKPLEETHWWNHSPAVQQQLRKAIQLARQGHSSRYDVAVRMKDDTRVLIDFMLNPIVGEDGQVNYLIPSAVEITSRTRAEEAVRSSEEQFRQLADALPQLCWMAHADGHIFWYNQRWYEYTGMTPEQMEGWGWQSVHDANELPKVLAHWRAALTAAQPLEVTFPLRRADGQFRRFLTRVVPVKDADGRVTRWIGTNTDIDEQKRVEETLFLQAEELARSNADLQQFAYAASHDLQEPLRMVSIFTELIRKKYEAQLDAEGQDFMNFAITGANRMGELLQGLLAYSRLSAPTDREPQAVDANLVLEKALFSLAVLIRETGARISYPDLPWVRIEEVRLQQLFQNLLGNALKYRVPLRSPVITVSVEAQDGWARFRISDNGVGISDDYRDQIFGLFKRLHRNQFSGSGIGLAICKRIVESAGGSIGVESPGEGQGSTFYFSLPVCGPQA